MIEWVKEISQSMHEVVKKNISGTMKNQPGNQDPPKYRWDELETVWEFDE